ncbi:potassium/proton antiporter [Plantactinospora sp. WMMB782]|uniref:potassium/proton antiporter n=1 Tax=Plantactinospora sp. WMMB782 TaxID=3404121 RepID=UPI003B930358
MIGFAWTLALLSLAAIAAVLSHRISDRLHIPAPAVFLLAAAAVSDLFPRLAELSTGTVRHIVTVALVAVLFNGGMNIGWRRLRPALAPVLWLGVLGTVLTALILAGLTRWIFGLGWLAALLVGTALAPTDPAAVFSVLGRREILGRTGTLLEGESGANDPVGIALMLGLLAAGSASGWGAVATGVREFALELAVGLLVGAAGGYLLGWAMRRIVLPGEGLYPLQVFFAGLAIYGLATVARGSGFLAVFVAGVLVGDVRAPYKREIERFHQVLASFGEIVAFSVLGLSVSLRSLPNGNAWLVGLVLAVLLTLVVRPLVVGTLLLPARLRWGERAFVAWAGLKGAVPILLGTFILTSDFPHELRLFDIIFVVVAFSVIVQGGLVTVVARLCRVPMRSVPLRPWAVGLRVQEEPQGTRRYQVADGSAAVGRSVQDVSRDEGVWVSLLTRAGEAIPVNRDTVLRPGDEVLVTVDPDEPDSSGALFTGEPDQSRR